MFGCGKCGINAPEGAKMAMTVVAARSVLYAKTDRYGNVVKDSKGNILGSEGYETVKETPLCPECAEKHDGKVETIGEQKIVRTKPQQAIKSAA